MKQFITHWSFALLMSAALVLTAACGSGGGRGGNGSDEPVPTGDAVQTTSATLELSFPAGAMLSALGTRAQATYADINNIDIEVLDSSLSEITTEAMVFGAGTWSLTINDLPVGESLTFNGTAYDSGAAVIFSGTTVQTLANAPESVTIDMDPAGVTITLPQVTSITVPAQVETNASDTVSFGLATAPNTDLDYDITAAVGGGSFAPSSNTIAVGAGGTATLNSTYTAPGTASTYEHSILITNEGNYSVAQGFQTVVVDAVTDVDVTVQFGPVLTALLVERPLSGGVPGSNLVFTATVDDDTNPGAVTFNWSFTPTVGTASFAVASANPATLNNYDASTEGTLTLVLTDEDALQTTLTYTMPAGLFFD